MPVPQTTRINKNLYKLSRLRISQMSNQDQHHHASHQHRVQDEAEEDTITTTINRAGSNADTVVDLDMKSKIAE